MHQISNFVYARDELLGWDIPTKRLPNPYHDFPYMIFKAFLSPEECCEITRFALQDRDSENAQLRGKALDKTIRNTALHVLPKELETLYEKRFETIRPKIEDFFSLSLSKSTKVQVLEYREGSFYLRHSDDSSELRDKQGNTIGFKPVAPERKLTTLLFTTSYAQNPTDSYHFSGGELLFNFLCDEGGEMITINPEAGDMVVFLSNPYFSHEVLPVTKGFRLSLAQWHDAL